MPGATQGLTRLRSRRCTEISNLSPLAGERDWVVRVCPIEGSRTRAVGPSPGMGATRANCDFANKPEDEVAVPSAGLPRGGEKASALSRKAGDLPAGGILNIAELVGFER
jgi:hypothetical protein